MRKPLLPKGLQPQPPPRSRRGRQRQEILRRFDPIQPQRVREPTNYQNEIVDLYEVARHEVEQKGRRFIRWRFIRDLEKDLTPRFMENIVQNVRTSFYLRHIYSVQLRNIENNSEIVFYTNIGSPWFNHKAEAEKWLERQEKQRLDSDNLKRPSTKWLFVGFFNVDLKVVLDRQPLLGTGPLPDWLRNLAHSRSMVALDTFNDNLCL